MSPPLGLAIEAKPLPNAVPPTKLPKPDADPAVAKEDLFSPTALDAPSPVASGLELDMVLPAKPERGFDEPATEPNGLAEPPTAAANGDAEDEASLPNPEAAKAEADV